MKVNSNTAGKRTIITKGAIILVWLTIAAFTSAAWAGTYSGGSGTAEDPYLISTAQDMNAIGGNFADWGKHFLLTADIDLSVYTGTEFNMIGYYNYFSNKPFTGIFDGNDHTISNFTYITTEYSSFGLFGYASTGAVIKDVTLIDPNVNAADASQGVGCLVGRLQDGTISGCGIESGRITGERGYTGGLVGNNLGTITDCYAAGNVTGDHTTGGLVASNSGTISNCYATGSVTKYGTGFEDAFATGGLVGYNAGAISDCYATVNVVGKTVKTGGLVGYNSQGTISDCYAAGSVSGNWTSGGLVGNNKGTISNSYATANVTGVVTTGGLVANNSGTISNCYATGSVTKYGTELGDAFATGGLVGLNWCGTISNCYATGNVTGYERVGGLVGCNLYGTISNCCAAGSITGDNSIGGLVGYGEEGVISNSYASGAASGIWGIGGLVGESFRGVISNSYASGAVTGDWYAGGLVGDRYEPGTVNNCFWDIETTGQSSSAAGEGKTTAEMRTGATFLVWTCSGNWTIDDGNDYPRLAWQNLPGEPLGSVLCDLLDGTGIEDQPYLVRTAEQLNLIGSLSCEWDKHFKLMADIDLSGYTGTEFNLIGYIDPYNEPDDKAFTGIFDGNGYAISNFTYETDNDHVGAGLFCYINGPNAVIKDLTLVNANVNVGGESLYIGCLVGMLRDGTVSGCGVEGGSVTGKYFTGGLVGNNGQGNIEYSYGNIEDSYSTASVTGEAFVGGLVGNNESGTISNCYAAGSVTGGWCIGGLVGDNWECVISNCYASGAVSGILDTGGLAGSNAGSILNCYATGGVSASGTSWQSNYYYRTYIVVVVNGMGYYCLENHTSSSSFEDDLAAGYWKSTTGGLVGDNYKVSISASFWDVNSSGVDISAGGEPKTTAQMQTMSTFTDAGWGRCEQIWTIDEGQDYPRLLWEGKPGQPLPLEQLSDFLTGGGTRADPYLIYTADQFNLVGLFSCEWDKCFLLVNDIDLSGFRGTEFNIIGRPDEPFTGVFDGAGRTISNFTYTATETDYIGVFGYVDDVNAVIKDLVLVAPDVNVGGYSYFTGCLVGRLQSGTIMGCGIEGGCVRGDGCTGALAGCNESGTISNCYAVASVSGRDFAGGLVGSNLGSVLDCYSRGDVTGTWHTVGGLAAYNGGDMSNCYSISEVNGDYFVGGLVGHNGGSVSDCYSASDVNGTSAGVGGLVGRNENSVSNCYSAGKVTGSHKVGGLVGDNGSSVSGCYSACDVNGRWQHVGGLVGANSGAISSCCAVGSVSGNESYTGGLAGGNSGTISNCYTEGSVSGGDWYTGGLVGLNDSGMVSDCYATGSVTGMYYTGGLVGWNHGGIMNCYATGSVTGDSYTGGLVGRNQYWTNACFWDIETTGQAGSAGGEGKTTEQMQTQSTFTNAGWDFDTPIWKICEGVDYPRLEWEMIDWPIIKQEPDMTTGTSNTISWQEVDEAIEYYAICCSDDNLENVVAESGWVDVNEYTFAGLETGKTYFYAVKARQNCVLESEWSDVVSSMQVTLSDIVEIMLDA
ncbi:MAG TPA: GLUG motif-containing protein, partial [Sedimentisphaerales bacterium]|nr:GLUG motif-containing protein [Sedimentisphaerales bacterium]